MMQMRMRLRMRLRRQGRRRQEEEALGQLDAAVPTTLAAAAAAAAGRRRVAHHHCCCRGGGAGQPQGSARLHLRARRYPPASARLNRGVMGPLLIILMMQAQATAMVLSKISGQTGCGARPVVRQALSI